MKLRLGFSILLVTLAIAENSSEQPELWCYECNADLNRQGHRGDCNDPYTPTSTDLVLCPRNETHLCLKSLIFYKNVHVTLRGCVPAREKGTYCSFKKEYPDASLECLFCSDYACNTSPPSRTSSVNRFLVVLLIAVASAISFGR